MVMALKIPGRFIVPFRAAAARKTTTRECPILWSRAFGESARRAALKPIILADIGEGITEVQIIQWFVQPGARVAQFDKLCEVQSDKASVDITSRFDGVIKTLHYDKDDVAKVGKPLLDIDVQPDVGEEVGHVAEGGAGGKGSGGGPVGEGIMEAKGGAAEGIEGTSLPGRSTESQGRQSGKTSILATPAVRRIIKELDIDITQVRGSGKDGRVLKEDVQLFATGQQQQQHQDGRIIPAEPSMPQVMEADKTVAITGVKAAMFRTMTRSLSISHFIYTDTIDTTALTRVRKKLNALTQTSPPSSRPKLSALPFIIKAVSRALVAHPTINAHLCTADESKPSLTIKAAHNFGIAVDSPSGLLVPVIHDVQNHSIASLALEIARLSALAQANRLSSRELQGATFTISNIGSIGGMVVSPLISAPQVAILGIGRARVVPAFDERGEVVGKEECVFSWSADHRVVDGATVARCAEEVRVRLEALKAMMVEMR